MVAAGAGEMVLDAECTPAHVGTRLDELLGDPERCARMAEAARAVGRPDAAARVVAFVEEVARGR